MTFQTCLIPSDPSPPNRTRHARLGRTFCVGLVGLLCSLRVAAHDFWIEPSSYAPAPNQTVTLRLQVGENFVGEPVQRPPVSSLHRFAVSSVDGPAQAVTVPGREGADPAGQFRLARPGAYVLAFHGKHNHIELQADIFNKYLAEEGLGTVLAERAERGASLLPATEMYARCAKTLVQVGITANADTPADRVLGLPLELFTQSSVAALREGQAGTVKLLLAGQPLPNTQVVALHREDRQFKLVLRSDAQGQVQLPTLRPGAWLVKAVHMRAAPVGSGAQWESLWASLSFWVGTSTTP